MENAVGLSAHALQGIAAPNMVSVVPLQSTVARVASLHIAEQGSNGKEKKKVAMKMHQG